VKKICLGVTLVLSPFVQADLLRIGAIGDLNGTECQALYPSNSITSFETMISKYSPDHVIFSGDVVHGECLSYSGNEPYRSVVARMWAEFDRRFFAKERASRTLAIAPGNHDAPYIAPGTRSRETFEVENAAFKTFWLAKEKDLGLDRVFVSGFEDNYPFFWAYIYEEVLFIVLHSTKSSGTISDATRQKAWLRALLKTPQAQLAELRLAYGHVPPYPVLDPSVGSKYSAFLKSEQSGQSNALVDILIDGNVNLLVVGHSHAPYPGELIRQRDQKRLKILSLPCSHSPRALYSKTARSDRGFAIIQRDEMGKMLISIKNYSTGKEIPYDYYPASIDVKSSAVRYQRIARDGYKSVAITQNAKVPKQKFGREPEPALGTR
jgi:hypothetical protein